MTNEIGRCNPRKCFICEKEFDGYIKIDEAFDKFKASEGYMPNENQYAEICKECSEAINDK